MLLRLGSDDTENPLFEPDQTVPFLFFSMQDAKCKQNSKGTTEGSLTLGFAVLEVVTGPTILFCLCLMFNLFCVE